MDVPPLPDGDDPDLLMFSYEPLPSPSCTRLLELEPDGAQDVRCTLHTVDLDDQNHPVFDALSYTWGSPITVFEDTERYEIPSVDEAVELAFPDLRGEAETSSSPEPRPRVFVDVDFDRAEFLRENPFPLYEDHAPRSDRSHPIKCGGRTLMVTQNLHEALLHLCGVGDASSPPPRYRHIDRPNALCHLRRVVGVKPEERDTAFVELGGRPRARYVWIDAISIDQDNVDERNAQVLIMNRIFRQAQMVVAWLGRGDTFSQAGLTLVSWLASLSAESGPVVPADRQSLINFPHTTSSQWFALFALIRRSWFRRAWIVQEISLAKCVVVVCGSLGLRWAALSESLLFLKRATLDKQLIRLATSAVHGAPSISFVGAVTGPRALSWPPRSSHRLVADAYRSALKDQWDPVVYVEGIRNSRLELGLTETASCWEDGVDPSTRSRYSPNETQWAYLRRFSKKSFGARLKMLVTRVRRKFRAPDRGAKGKQGSDVDLWSVTKRGNLVVVDHSRRRPSTVPISALLWRFRLTDSTDPRDKIYAFRSIAAISPSTWTGLENVVPDYRKPVREVYAETALGMIQGQRNLNVLSSVQDRRLDKVEGLPSWVPDFSVQMATRRLGYDDFLTSIYSAAAQCELAGTRLTPLTTSSALTIRGVLWDVVVDITHPAETYFASIVRLALTLFEDEDTQSVNIGPRETDGAGRTRGNDHVVASESDTDAAPETAGDMQRQRDPLEMLWRTLMADQLAGQHPAPDFCETAFIDWMHLKIVRACNALVMAESLKNGLSCNSRMAANALAFARLFHKGPESFYRLCDGFRLGYSQIYLDVLADPAGAVQSHRDRDPQGRFPMVPRHRLSDAEQVQLAMFKAQVKEVRKGRRMFLTQKGALGLGPASTEKDDQIWILPGASVPFVLRETSPRRHRLVGETYVYGIMDGEVMRAGGEKELSDIVMD